MRILGFINGRLFFIFLYYYTVFINSLSCLFVQFTFFAIDYTLFIGKQPCDQWRKYRGSERPPVLAGQGVFKSQSFVMNSHYFNRV